MEEQVIYINFIAEINEKTTSHLLFLLTDQIRSGIKKFHINIASNGGTIFHAVSIFNFLNGLEGAEIHTHNLGQLDSSANLFFLAGHKRTASKASTFLLHPPQMNVAGNASLTIDFLKERVNSIEKDQIKMAEIIADKIRKTPKEVLKMFQSRKTYSSHEALELGFIDSIQEYIGKPGIPMFSITNQ
ncbi:MAG TPA: ATP-dependent Clp protease proteolytic subunit [Bacteroidales bacterium]|nr:ATP-dependent Clp protease proteolytic subunit [Bacteroidales bacterium]